MQRPHRQARSRLLHHSDVDGDILQHIERLAPQLLASVIEPFVQFLIPGALFWWPCLAGALAVALAAYWLHSGGRGASLGAFRRRYFGAAIWAHPSAQADYAYYIVNSILHPAIVAPFILSGAVAGLWVAAGLAWLLGPLQTPVLGVGVLRGLYTVLFFVAYDFARYVAHSLLHDVKLLWQFHKLHHSAEVLTPVTTFRAHPVELMVMAAFANAATGLVSGVVWYAAAGEIGLLGFVGLHVFLAAFNIIANLRHSPVWVSFGPVLNRWFISPAHHQIHHSCEPRHLGKNRGFELALWDRLFGTLYLPVAGERFRLGLGDGTDGAWHSVGRMYGWPLRYAMARLGLGAAPVDCTIANTISRDG
jgi:sterol desaturase/sphingolipid hydroxylase (fatty acid hydroxylase superfamily)